MRNWQETIRARLSGLHLSPERESEIIEELSQHLDDRYEELRTGGADAIEARRLALDELDDHELLRREMKPLRQASTPAPIVPGGPRRHIAADIWQDVRYAARMLMKQPGFTCAAMLTLALGIGANTAIFSLANATLFRRLPVNASDQLLYVFNGVPGNVFPYPAYVALRDGARTVDGLAAWGPLTASLNADAETDLVPGVIVTGNFFDLLAISAQRGRLLGPQDDVTVGAHPVAVISDRLWRRRFAARDDIVGRQILLNGHSFTVVGVTPRNFFGPQVGMIRDLYVPMMMQAVMRPPRSGYSGEMNPDLLHNVDNSWLFPIARVKAGQTAEQVSAELTALSTTFARQLRPSSPVRQVPVIRVDDGMPGQQEQVRRVALLLGGVGTTVLLIACGNVANLLLSRAASRRRELAVRIAIGANRWRLVRQLLTESLLLSLMGGAAGVGLAVGLAAAFRAAPPPSGALPIAIDFDIDSRVLLFAFALSLLTGMIFGLGPAIGASRPNLVPALKDGGAGLHSRAGRFGLKKLLVIVEVALSLMLLVAAGLFVRSLQRAYSINPGFDVEHLLSAPLNVNLLRYTRAQGREFYARTVERMAAIPGVRSASVARMPLLSPGRNASLTIEGRSAPADTFVSTGGGMTTRDSMLTNIVGPGFFETLGIGRISGRDFSSVDTESSTPVVIINESSAKVHFPGVDPIGKRMKFGAGPWTEVIGIVRDSAYESVSDTGRPIAYLPLSQNHETGVTLYVRASMPPSTLVSAVRKEIQQLEPNLPLSNIAVMADTITTSLYAPRMGAWLLTVFGGLALLLATVGMYGVLAFSVARRTREMGVRIALGAHSGNVVGLVIREGVGLVVIGTAIGLLISWFTVRSLETFLYGIEPTNIATFIAVTALLVVVALVACLIPARRAMRVDPITALRAD